MREKCLHIGDDIRVLRLGLHTIWLIHININETAIGREAAAIGYSRD